MTGTCKDCAFATWATTPTGRPRSEGTCGWRPGPMPVAIWADQAERWLETARTRPRVTIWRDEARECAVFVPAKLPA